jgi:hypothetical protein
MKKLFLSLLLVLAFSVNAFAAAGSCTQELSYAVSKTRTSTNTILTYNCTWGTAGDATTALTLATTDAITANLVGWRLLMCTTYNGATAPSPLYDLTLKETIGSTAAAVDILGTAGMNRPGTAGVSSQFTPITDTTYATGGLRPVMNTLTLTADGNSVASGNAIVQCIFVE